MAQGPEVQVRRAEPEDAEGMNRTIYEAWLVTYPNEEHRITREDIEHHFRDALTEAGILRAQEAVRKSGPEKYRNVAVASGEVVGVGQLIREADANHLRTLYVRPAWQGKGVGRALWEDLRLRADPHKDAVLEVTEYNERAIRFYERLRFRDTGERLADERFRMRNGAILPEMRMRRPAD